MDDSIQIIYGSPCVVTRTSRYMLASKVRITSCQVVTDRLKFFGLATDSQDILILAHSFVRQLVLIFKSAIVSARKDEKGYAHHRWVSRVMDSLRGHKSDVLHELAGEGESVRQERVSGIARAREFGRTENRC